MRDAGQVEHLALQIGQFGLEDLDGMAALQQRMALGEARPRPLSLADTGKLRRNALSDVRNVSLDG